MKPKGLAVEFKKKAFAIRRPERIIDADDRIMRELGSVASGKLTKIMVARFTDTVLQPDKTGGWSRVPRPLQERTLPMDRWLEVVRHIRTRSEVPEIAHLDADGCARLSSIGQGKVMGASMLQISGAVGAIIFAAKGVKRGRVVERLRRRARWFQGSPEAFMGLLRLSGVEEALKHTT